MGDVQHSMYMYISIDDLEKLSGHTDWTAKGNFKRIYAV